MVSVPVDGWLNPELAATFLLQACFGLLNELANLIQLRCRRLMLAKKLGHQRNDSAADILHQSAEFAFHHIVGLNHGLISGRRLVRFANQSLVDEAIETRLYG